MESVVSMSGRLGTNAERRISRHDSEYVQFRLATTRRIQRDGEWTDGETTWVSVRCYRTLAKNAHYSLRKGDPVVVVGKLRVESWVNDAGVRRETTVLDAQALGHDLNLGTSRFDRGSRSERSEPVSTHSFEGEVVDPETGEIVDLANCDVPAEADGEGFEHEPVSEEMTLSQ